MSDMPTIELLILLEKASGKEKIVYLFQDAPGDQAMELFVTPSGSTYVLYHLDSYYDERLRERRNTNNMFISRTRERLQLVGKVWNTTPYAMKDHILLGRTTLVAKQILIDEK